MLYCYYIFSNNSKQLTISDADFPTINPNEILAEGQIDEPMLGYVYMQRKTNKKDFFEVLDKHLVPSKALQKFIKNVAKLDAPENVKTKLISQVQWYLEVQDWLYRVYVFIKEEAN